MKSFSSLCTATLRFVGATLPDFILVVMIYEKKKFVEEVKKKNVDLKIKMFTANMI